MQLVTYNIQYGRGRDDQYDLARIAAAVQGADVIALQEVARHWQRNDHADQAAELADLIGSDYHWVYGAGLDLDASGDGGPTRKRRQFGNMLLSRAPILSVRNHLLPKVGTVGEPISIQRAALECVLRTPNGTLLRFVSLHLSHLAAEVRLPQVDLLLRLHRDAVFEGAALTGGGLDSSWVKEGLPDPMPREAILLGDFNMEPDSREYARLVGPVSEYGGRVWNPERFVDAWVQAGHPESTGQTSDVRGRPARLDYCLVSTPLRDRIRSARIDEEAEGSDHQPLWVQLDL